LERLERLIEGPRAEVEGRSGLVQERALPHAVPHAEGWRLGPAEALGELQAAGDLLLGGLAVIQEYGLVGDVLALLGQLPPDEGVRELTHVARVPAPQRLDDVVYEGDLGTAEAGEVGLAQSDDHRLLAPVVAARCPDRLPVLLKFREDRQER